MVEALGLPRDRQLIEVEIGPLGPDPQDAWDRLEAHARVLVAQRTLL